eukprot:2527043-Rhodomonas_salina.3
MKEGSMQRKKQEAEEGPRARERGNLTHGVQESEKSRSQDERERAGQEGAHWQRRPASGRIKSGRCQCSRIIAVQVGS